MTDGYVHTDWGDDAAQIDRRDKVRLPARSSHEGETATERIRRTSGVALGPLPEPVSLYRDKMRFQGLALGYKNFGTPEQMKAVAERIRHMMSVELHQDVIVINGPYDVDEVWFKSRLEEQLCICNRRGSDGPDESCPVHGRLECRHEMFR